MSTRVLPAVVAGILAIAVAALLFVPFVAREHRKRGELRPGAVLLRFAALLYALGLSAYVLIPLPPIAPGFCASFQHLRPRWVPFGSLDAVLARRLWTEPSELLANEAVRQFGYNIALFVPLGMLVRALYQRTALGTMLIGFAVSLVVETTQLSGIWGLYPCPYRLFDVDDLIANTGGALVGILFAPLLRPMPSPREEPTPDHPRPVTSGRRLLGMVCDLALLWWLGLSASRVAELIRPTAAESGRWLESAALWFAPASLLLLLTSVAGSTLGQHAVRLRSVTADGRRPGIGRTMLRWCIGLGGLAAIEGLIHPTEWSDWGAVLAVSCCTVHAFGVTRSRDHRGITGAIAGLYVVDARSARTRASTEAITTQKRG